MAQQKMRRLAVGREVFSEVALLSDKARQTFYTEITRFRMGSAVSMKTLTGASVYEQVRLDGGISIIMKRIGDLFLALWAGPDPMAQEWADTHLCETNERTRSVQVYEIADTMTVSAGPLDQAPVFEALSNDDLLDIGLPKDRLANIRSVKSEDDLVRMQAQLPDRVYEMLIWYVQGEPWAKIVEAYKEDIADKQAVVETGDCLLDAGHFRIVETDEELRNIMDQPLAQWRVFLHPSQRKLVDRRWHGAARITGGAGTGKTVVALHRAKHLVELPDWLSTDRLLFTTFTKNLAVDVEAQLRMICSREDMKHITVLNLDAWLATFLSQNGQGHRIVYPGGSDGIYNAAWQSAIAKIPMHLGFPIAFYQDEWEQVVLPQHCHTARDYLFASRAGRGNALTRAQRKEIWPVFEELRIRLSLANAVTPEDAACEAINILQKSYPEGLFRAVVCDEIQDFKPDTLRLLRALTRDISKDEPFKEGDLFLVGDAHQRIYAKPVAFSSCGIEIRGRSNKLRVNYRTTDEIRVQAEQVYRNKTVDDMEGAEDEKTGYASLRHGRKPIVKICSGVDEECRWICGEINTLTSGDRAYHSSDICITVRTNEMLARYEEILRGHGLEVRRISRDIPDDPELPGIRLSTMHRIKGLEYKVVFVAGMNEGEFPHAPRDLQDRDAATRRLLLRAEEALYYVACTRAVDVLFLSCGGNPGAFIRDKSA